MWEIDEHEIQFLMAQFVALQMANSNEQVKYIDDVL